MLSVLAAYMYRIKYRRGIKPVIMNRKHGFLGVMAVKEGPNHQWDMPLNRKLELNCTDIDITITKTRAGKTTALESLIDVEVTTIRSRCGMW